MLFDVNRPTTEGQLRRLYTGNPNLTPDEVDSNLFLSSSQGRDYIQQQGRNLGIGDPAEYYGRMQMAAQLAGTQSGGQAEAMRQTGQYSANSLPGQLAMRDKMWNAVGAQDAASAQHLAALQNSNRLTQFPLPAAGQSPSLSPVMQEDMRQQGISNPMEYLMAQRLGTNRNAVGSLAGLQGAVDPEALYNEGTFRNGANQNPRQAAGVFNALTGKDLGAYDAAYRGAADTERKRGTSFLFDALSKGEAGIDDQGALRWRKRIADPMTGKMTLSPEFEVGDAFQRSQEKHLPYVDRDISTFKALSAKRAAGAAAAPAPVAGLQMQINGNEVPVSMRAGSEATNTVGNFLGGYASDFGNMLTGQPLGSNATRGYTAPSGNAATHARSVLGNNPRFQELMRTNPESARRILMAIQQGRGAYDTSSMTTPGFNTFDPGASSY